jgi:DNA-binding transcriptional LysR family regulator
LIDAWWDAENRWFLVTVVAEGSFSQAAERVFCTQAAASIAIRRLEEEIGAPLFERSQKTATPYGSW